MFWLFMSMLIPLWIPLTAMGVGAIADARARRRGTAALTGAAAIVAQIHTGARSETLEPVAA